MHKGFFAVLILICLAGTWGFWPGFALVALVGAIGVWLLFKDIPG